MRNSLLLAMFSLASLCGCGGGNSTGPGPQPISVAFSTAPPTSLATGATVGISATVSNDASGGGVNWSCAPAGACGTFDHASTASGAMTNYTAPTPAPAGGTVTITAASATDATKTTSKTVSIGISVAITTAPPASLQTLATANVTATVTNDTANLGVNWTCAPVGTCGSFVPAATATGVATVYHAPAAVPAGGTVTITATSASDNTRSDSKSVTIIAPAISVAFTTPPPAALPGSASANIVATVTNDTANPAVNWTCTPTGTCGSFAPTATASGAATVYTAPATPPTGGTVTITATSITDNTKKATANVTISKPASVATLKGKYAFIITAPTGARGTTTFIGSVELDGNGNVLGGVEDVIATLYNDQADPIWPTSAFPPPTTSNYKVDPNGHGRLRLVTHNNNETLDISFVVTSPSHASIIEADGEPGSGTMDLQTPTASGFAASQVSGNYSFTLDGVNTTNPPTSTISFGGIFNADGISSITTATLDANRSGSFTTQSTTGTFMTPDSATGRGKLILFGPGRSWTYYIVSARVLRLFEDDNIDFTGGSAYSQGTTAGTTLPAKCVYQHSGWSAAGRTVAAGQFSANTTNMTSGASDSNSGGRPAVPNKNVAVSGAYAIPVTLNGTITNFKDAAGTSNFNLYVVDPTLNILDPNNSSGGGGALLLHTDANITGTGVIIPQTISATPTFTGTYALDLSNSIAVTTPNELDLVGVLTSDSAASFTNGVADYDQNDTFNPQQMLGATLAGTFLKDNTNVGRFTGTVTVTQPAAPLPGYSFIPGSASPNILAVSFYQASASQAFVIETDALANTQGTLLQQLLP
jgi:hypothetical protein